MAKVTKKQNPWNGLHKPMTVTAIAEFLELSTTRVRQVIAELGIEPVDRIGNVPFYSNYAFLLINNRNTKPGPKREG